MTALQIDDSQTYNNRAPSLTVLDNTITAHVMRYNEAEKTVSATVLVKTWYLV